MNMDTKIQRKIIDNFNEHRSVLDQMLREINKDIENAGLLMSQTIENGNKILWLGNGGSCADAQHLSAECTGRFRSERAPLNSISLTADTSVITCIGNDYSFDDIFSRQIEALVKKGDLVIALSTSGNSCNVIKALEKCKELNINSICLSGNQGGLAKQIANQNIIVPSRSTARIQEIQILIGHILIEIVEINLQLCEET